MRQRITLAEEEPTQQTEREPENDVDSAGFTLVELSAEERKRSKYFGILIEERDE
jgi:hypothetical protein